MSSEESQFLNLRNLPGRFTVQQTGWYLGFPMREIPNLTRARLLRPAGRPTIKATKVYAYPYLRRLHEDERWMNRASDIIYGQMRVKHQTAKAKKRRRS
jgi:hypothetical protein